MAGLHHAEPGGPAVTLELSPTVTVSKLSVGRMDNNAYLLTPSGAGAVLIDAADEPERILELVGDRPVATIITTHRHGDHWQALPGVSGATRAQLICGRPDLDAIATGAWVENLNGVWDGDSVALGDEALEVIGIVGHTPGSITLVYAAANGPAHLFTGDSLFPGGPGKTWAPGDFTSLLDDLEEKIFARFDDATVVHPGHGDATTLGTERPHLGEWRQRGW
jgi:glyoxylase-like metal-dependent hydrolase (beta-lactamase superfamily II)